MYITVFTEKERENWYFLLSAENMTRVFYDERIDVF